MANWLYETGIGEARAALVEGDAIIEAHIEPDDEGLRAGTICTAQLIDIMIPGRRGVVRTTQGEALLEPLPAKLTQGASLLIEVRRAALPEPGNAKRALARPAAVGATPMTGPSLWDRITATGLPVQLLAPHTPDALEAAGWSECLEEAALGHVRFAGGTLRISLTPAMTMIDIDGHLPPYALACAAASAAGAAIRRFGIAGSIGIDFPTLANKAERVAVAEAVDAALPQPFERTAINGFGFLQIIRPRERASLCEQLQYDRLAAAARALLRRAQRAHIIGAARLNAHPCVIDEINRHPSWLESLGQQLGGSIDLHTDPALGMDAGYASKA